MQQVSSQKILDNQFNDTDSILEAIETDLPETFISQTSIKSFPVRAPVAFVKRIKKGDPDDPLLKQILPVKEEENVVEGYTTDPLAELKTEVVPGLLHKYYGRALMVVTGACAIHCRYCFRRHFPYSESNPKPNHWQQALDYLEKDKSISEIILSGGDPLTLSDKKLSALIMKLSRIEHLERVRIHTRIPIVMPTRISNTLLSKITGTRLQIVFVVHVNHSNELDGDVEKAIKQITVNNITIFNQSVLLKGVNDTVNALSELSIRLFSIGIIPYYLHMLDPVAGAAHFKVDISTARSIMKELHKILPGYLVPRLVSEIAGAQYKIPVEMALD